MHLKNTLNKIIKKNYLLKLVIKKIELKNKKLKKLKKNINENLGLVLEKLKNWTESLRRVSGKQIKQNIYTKIWN